MHHDFDIYLKFDLFRKKSSSHKGNKVMPVPVNAGKVFQKMEKGQYCIKMKLFPWANLRIGI